MPTEIPQSLIDEAGWEVLWTIDADTGQIVTQPHYGRPPISRNDIDAVGNEHLWETAWDGSGIYNFRWGRMNVYGNGTNQPTGSTPGGGGGGSNNPPAVVDHSKPTIQVGTTRMGQPVLQLTDRDGVVKQWFVLNGSTTDLTNANTYGVMVHTAATEYVAPPAPTGGGGTVTHPGDGTSLERPTKQVGTTAGGIPVMQLVDAAGVVKQWFITNAGLMDLVNAQTYGVLFHTAATDAIPQVSQPLSKPTIQIGTTAHGDPIKQLVDEAGTVKQWVVINGQTADLVNAQTYGVIFHTATTDQPLVDGTGGTTTHVPITDTAGGMSSSAMLGLAAIAGVGLVLFLNRRKTA